SSEAKNRATIAVVVNTERLLWRGHRRIAQLIWESKRRVKELHLIHLTVTISNRSRLHDETLETSCGAGRGLHDCSGFRKSVRTDCGSISGLHSCARNAQDSISRAPNNSAC